MSIARRPVSPHCALVAGARFSSDRAHRYTLWRRWGGGPWLMVIGLNPSTADETRDDPTIRRCIGYARQWRFGGLVMTNLFAFRATNPRELLQAKRPLGDGNLATIVALARSVSEHGGAVLAAWGAHGRHLGCSRAATSMLEDGGLGVACLGRTVSGEPRHPLYLPRIAAPQPYVLDGGALCARRAATSPAPSASA